MAAAAAMVAAVLCGSVHIRLTQRDEVGAGLRQRGNLVVACRIADAGDFEQLRPPGQALHYVVERHAATRAPSLTLPRTRGREMMRTLSRLRGREMITLSPLAGRVGWGFAEHHVIGASLGGEHGTHDGSPARRRRRCGRV